MREGFLSLRVIYIRGTSRCCGVMVLWSFVGVLFSKPPFVWSCSNLSAAGCWSGTPSNAFVRPRRYAFAAVISVKPIVNSVWSKIHGLFRKIQHRSHTIAQYTCIIAMECNCWRIDHIYLLIHHDSPSCQLGCITNLWNIFLDVVWCLNLSDVIAFDIGKPWQTERERERDWLTHVARFCVEYWHAMITVRLCTQSVCASTCLLFACLCIESWAHSTDHRQSKASHHTWGPRGFSLKLQLSFPRGKHGLGSLVPRMPKTIQDLCTFFVPCGLASVKFKPSSNFTFLCGRCIMPWCNIMQHIPFMLLLLGTMKKPGPLVFPENLGQILKDRTGMHFL